jgi:3-hydroxyisobutyrate dehydrogenase
MEQNETVAVLGAGGTMGLPMARNIKQAGIEVRAWNRSTEKAQPLGDDGIEIFDTPKEAAAGASIVLSILSDADAVLETAEAALETAEAALESADDKVIWLQMSTIGEAGTERCIDLAGERGVAFIDAPVLGTKQPAEQGKLVVLASGAEEVRERLQPIFDAVAQKTMWIGEAGASTRLKLVLNSWVLTVTEGAAETIALAEGLGLDPALLFEALDGGTLDLPYLRMKGKAIVERNFEPAFRLALAAKDAALVRDAAKRRGLDLPVLEAVRERMAEGAKQHGDEDMSATYLTSAPKHTVT